jgi:hypothetical protein
MPITAISPDALLDMACSLKRARSSALLVGGAGTRPDHPISGPQATMFVNLDAEARVAGPSLQSFTDDKGRATVSRGLRSAATPQIISIMAARTISAEPNR